MSKPTIVTIIDILVEARDLLTCVTVLREHDEQFVADDIEGKLAMAIKRALATAHDVYTIELTRASA